MAALKKVIEGSDIQVKVDFNKLWEMIVHADDSSLKKHGWIVNCSPETVKFHVYRSNDVLRWIPSQVVHVQPGEKVEVQGGFLQKEHESMVIYKDGKGTAHNVKKNTLHFWTGSALIGQGSSIQQFKTLYHNPRAGTATALLKQKYALHTKM